jgi:hypothetical protein
VRKLRNLLYPSLQTDFQTCKKQYHVLLHISEICLQTQVAPASLILWSCEAWADFSVKIHPVYLFTDLFIYLFIFKVAVGTSVGWVLRFVTKYPLGVMVGIWICNSWADFFSNTRAWLIPSNFQKKYYVPLPLPLPLHLAVQNFWCSHSDLNQS